MSHIFLVNQRFLNRLKNLKTFAPQNINATNLFRLFGCDRNASGTRLYGCCASHWKCARTQSTVMNVVRRLMTTKPNVTAGRARNKINRSEVSRLMSLAKPEKWRLLGAVCLLFVSSAVSMAVPFSLGKVIDLIYAGTTERQEARHKLNNLCGILVIVFVIGAVCNFGRIYIMTTAAYRMTQRLRYQTFSALMRQEVSWLETRKTSSSNNSKSKSGSGGMSSGELANRLSADAQLVGHSLSSNVSDGLRSGVMVLAGGGMMIYTSPQLAAVALSVVPPVALMAVLYGRFVRKITRSVQDSLAEASSHAEEKISNIRTVRTFGKEHAEAMRYRHLLQQVLQLGYRESLARAVFYGMTGLSGNMIILSVLYYGGSMVSDLTITVGNLSAFLLYAAYIGVSIGGLSTFYSEFNKSIGAANRLWEIVDSKAVIKSGIIPHEPVRGHIHFENVRFRYPARPETLILRGLTLDVAAGTTVAVVGASGSGKSTIGSLLLRLYEPESGSISLDSHDTSTLDPTYLRSIIGTVSQEPVLFSGTIRDNILYGAPQQLVDPTIMQLKLQQVIAEANVEEFLKDLPDGLDTVVGERGVMLSGGQKQRIAIARALIKDPKILLLDEATSALDAKSERLVRDALTRAAKGRTTLTIAHRLSTVRGAQLVAVVRDGQIVESGPYADLLSRQGGLFRELVELQAFFAGTDDATVFAPER